MSFKTASALLRGIWLIDPAYAKAQMPLILQMLQKGSVMDASAGYKDRAEYKPKIGLPEKRNFAAVATDVYGVTPYTSMDRLPFNSIAMVDIIGPILKYGDYCTYGSVEYNDLLVRLANNNRVTGIILNVDSPGGQADGTAMVSETIRQIGKESKPIVSLIQDGIAASAAYGFLPVHKKCIVHRQLTRWEV
jgi:protease-4